MLDPNQSETSSHVDGDQWQGLGGGRSANTSLHLLPHQKKDQETGQLLLHCRHTDVKQDACADCLASENDEGHEGEHQFEPDPSPLPALSILGHFALFPSLVWR